MAAGEKWSVGASMYLSPAYTVGGSLSVTSSALRFLGGENRDIALAEISEVRVVRQRWWHPRRTVQVLTHAGDSAWFLVNRQAEVASRISEAATAAGGGPVPR